MLDELAHIKLHIAAHLEIDVDIIEDDTPIAELGADSLDVVEFLTKLEETYGVYVPDEDITSLKTPRLVAEYIDRYR